MKSWKTTITGALLLGGAIILFLINRPVEGGMAALSGIGLLAAKDSTVTGVGDDAKTKNEMEKEN